jgi:hypothetical protein
VAFPGAAAHPLGEIRHLVQNGMDFGHHVLAVVHDGSAPRRAQGDVQHRALLRGVDPVAAEHGVDAIPQARLLGKLKQQLNGLVGNPVLGVVEIDSRGLYCEPFAAPAILGEELAEVKTSDLLVVLLEQRPGRTQVESPNAH